MSELHRIWRIATRGPSWAGDDLSGNGSARSAGRWNSTGMPVVYASTTIALACLETVVHGAGLPVRLRPCSDEPADLFRHRPPLSRVMSLEAMEQAVAAALATPDPRDASLISPAPAAPATPPDLRHSGNQAEPGRSLPASAG